MQNTNTRSTMFNGLLKLVLRDTNNITPTSAILVVFGEQNEVCPRQSPSRKNKHQRLTRKGDEGQKLATKSSHWWVIPITSTSWRCAGRTGCSGDSG